VWRASGLKPHRAETFRLSIDPASVAKARDVVGLYLNPPDRARVLCVDERWAAKRTNGVRALDPTQPLLPMRLAQAERRTHEHARHGTTALVAALDVRAGTAIGRCLRRHRATEFRRLLGTVGAAVPADLDVHVVLDGAGTPKTKLIRGWGASTVRPPSRRRASKTTSRRRTPTRGPSAGPSPPMTSSPPSSASGPGPSPPTKARLETNLRRGTPGPQFGS
jgi:hypothetical protein